MTYTLKKRRLLALCICLVFIVVSFHLTTIIVEHSNHTHKDMHVICQLCIQIQKAEAILRQITLLYGGLLLLFFLCLYLMQKMHSSPTLICNFFTLVDAKVRMDN